MQLTVHRYWTGPPMPARYEDNRRAWEALGFYVEDQLDGLPHLDAPAARARANMMRLDMLTHWGGVWADCDLTPPGHLTPGALEHDPQAWQRLGYPPDDREGVVLGYTGARPCAALLAGPARHPLWEQASAVLAEDPERLLGDVLAELAPWWPHTGVNLWGGGWRHEWATTKMVRAAGGSPD